MATPNTPTPGPTPGAMAAPERYGKYNLLERIGQGGMAEVWRAKTLGTEGFTKDLVIKRILPRFSADEDFVRSFIDEARLVARLQHANIVQIFDFDKVGDTYYLAMELVEGRDLRQTQRAAAKAGTWFTIPMAVYLIAEACKGLHYAHTKVERGQALRIVHRDVSPHNILISLAGDVKLADFGIAKVEARASHTAIGMVKGKLSYMSPEQVAGQPLDPRTDIYSMGIVLWELLTRRRLFTGSDEADVVLRVRDAVVPPPRQLNPEVPEALERLVMHMLTLDREARYQSAGEVARELCALPAYAYEAQALGDLVHKLFPQEQPNWTMMLQSVTDSLEIVNMNSTSEAPPPPAAGPARSNMAGSDQKTQIATQVPPEVARLIGQAGQAGGQQPQAPAAPVGAAEPMARTMMAQAPNLPPGAGGGPPAGAPPPAAAPPAAAPPAAANPGLSGARTMIAQAPTNLPPMAGGAPHAAGAPPPGTAPAAGSNMPPSVAAGGFAQGLPPGWPAGGAPPGGGPAVKSQGGNPQATMLASGPATLPPPAGRSMAPPLQLHQMSELGGPAAAGGAPSLLRWASGPAVMLLTMALTAMLCNRIWPPATGSGGHGPTLFAMKASVRLVTTPAGATVYVDDEALSEKTPAAVRGAVGKKAKVRVVLDGFEPYEATVLFTSDERPPLNVTLFRKGQGPKQLKGQDPTLYDDRPGTKTRPDPDEDAVEDNSAGKATAQKDPGPDKAAKDPGPDKAQKNPKGGDEDPDGDKGEGPDKVAAKDPPEPDAAVPATRPGRRRRDKPEPVAVAAPKSTKATLSVLVRPWAVVYVDNKKIKQTPLRDFALSPGKHTILLVNDAKGKREVVPLSAAAGENYPITRNWD